MKFRDLQYLIESVRFSKFHRFLIFSKFLNNKLLNIRLEIRYFKMCITVESHLIHIQMQYILNTQLQNL